MSLLSRLFARQKWELEEEIDAHLQMAIQDRMDRGQPPEQARRAAMREFGNVGLVKDVTREVWGWIRLERFGKDLKFALRQMRKSPGFTFTVVATLAIGLGATAAMFTVVDRVLLRPLPYRDAHQLVEIKEAGKRGAIDYGAPFLDIEQWRGQSRTFQDVAFYSTNTQRVSFLEGNAGSMQVIAPAISANLLTTLGVQPAMGRGFLEQQNSGGGPASRRPFSPLKRYGLADCLW